MSHTKLIAFDRPLADAALPGGRGRVFSESEVHDREETAYRRGADEARALTDRQVVELRAEVKELNEGILQTLATIESALLAQIQEQLPELVVTIGRHLLAGYEPPPDVVARICTETLEQLYPERENLELTLCPRDADLLAHLDPDWLKRYPGLHIVTDSNLVPGDCKVRSRFGLTDALQETKLAALQHHLAPVA